jgi:hypothetical protein
MSMFASLLLGNPIDFPAGVCRTHIAEPWDDEPEKPPVSVYFRPHCAQTKAENIEAVFRAIASGAHTMREIMAWCGLSKLTTGKALQQLERWPSGPRIVRERGSSNRPDRFMVATCCDKTHNV